MIVQPRQLAGALKKDLPAVIALSSADSFLLGEAADQVRAVAKKLGYSERQKLQVERNADWEALIHQAQSLSLFDDRKLIEIHLPSAKPGDAGAKAIQEYISIAPEENRLLLMMGKVEQQSLRSKWFKSLEKSALVCRLWPIAVHEMPAWISNRVREKSGQIDTDAVQLLAERVEGNLLAASQEIDKLILVSNGANINSEQVMRSIGNSARYSAFDLLDASLLGQSEGALRMLHGLQSEGVDARSVLWALSFELRKIDTAMGNGGPREAQAYFQRQRMPKQRAQALQQFLGRAAPDLILQLQGLAAETDRRIKGASIGSPWDVLTEMVLQLCGRPCYLVKPQN